VTGRDSDVAPATTVHCHVVMSRRLALGALAAVVLAASSRAAQPPAAPRSNFEDVGWRELRYEAHKWLLGAATTTRLELVPATSVALRTAPGNEGVPPGGPLVARLSTSTDLPFGRAEQAVTWFDPATGAALQYEKQLSGRKPALRDGRYTLSGLHVWRTDPAGRDEADRPPAAWTRRRDGHISPQPPMPPGARLVDSYTMLYLVSAAGLESGAELRLLTVSRERLGELRLAARQPVERKVHYDEARGDTVRRRDGTLSVVPVEVSARPFGDAPDGPAVDLAFMGLRGALTVYLEPATRVPVAVVGRAEKVGEVTVRLVSVTLADEGPQR
jgi:hypothetical protein